MGGNKLNNFVMKPRTKQSDLSIKVNNISKKYGNFYANYNIDLDIVKGEIHSLVGQNGAGKSTLLGVLSGRIAPSSGTVHVFNQELNYGDPRSSKKLGIATIYQELTIIPELNALENVFLGQTISKYGFISKSEMLKEYKRLSVVMEINIPPFVSASNLSIADQQILEIMRGLQLNAKVLILDEPTASLAPPERKSLLKIVKSLSSKGITVLYVSHHLDEVLEISDRITLLRDGQIIKTEMNKYWTKEKLVANMMGKKLKKTLENNQEESIKSMLHDSEEILKCINLTVPGVLTSINFSAFSGEILGIGGLVGSGRSTLVRSIAGLENESNGEMYIENKKVRWPKSPRTSMKYGIAFAPEDRKDQGLVLGLTVQENINMVKFKNISKFGFYKSKSANQIATHYSDQFGLTKSIKTECRKLSGGNQQKVLLSKVCNLEPKILIVDEPTRGIDVSVKSDVINILKDLASKGMCIVIISSELEEIVEVSDRILVLSKGKIVNELTGGKISVSNILNSTFQGGQNGTY